MSANMDPIRRRPQQPINYEFHRQRALRERNAFIREALPSVPPNLKRRVTLFITAFAVASGAFWATMLTDPPQTVAGQAPFSIHELQQRAPLDLPIGEADSH